MVAASESLSHPIGFNTKAASAARPRVRSMHVHAWRRPGGGPEHSEGIAVSPKELKRGAFNATRFRPHDMIDNHQGACEPVNK